MCKSIYILGTALSHDGSTCLMKTVRLLSPLKKKDYPE